MPPFSNPYASTNPWLTAGESSESNSSYRTPKHLVSQKYLFHLENKKNLNSTQTQRRHLVQLDLLNFDVQSLRQLALDN